MSLRTGLNSGFIPYPGRGFQRVARGRGAIATTTPGTDLQSIRPLKGVPETLAAPWTVTPSAARCRGRILLPARIPGSSSLTLLDPELKSAIPFGIRKRGSSNESLIPLELHSALPFARPDDGEKGLQPWNAPTGKPARALLMQILH